MQGLTHQSCVKELKSKVQELTGIPCDVQKIMVGYPPSSLDLRNGDAHLKDYPIKSGTASKKRRQSRVAAVSCVDLLKPPRTIQKGRMFLMV